MLKCISDPSPKTDWFDEWTIKNLIVLHGTAGLTYTGIDATLDIEDRINVHYVITRDGLIRQRFPESGWAYHTGYKESSQRSIGIELESWVIAQKLDGKFYNAGYNFKKEIPADEILELQPFRGIKYYHALTKKQKDVLYLLILELQSRHPIPADWHREINSLPTAQKKGIITHAVIKSTRYDYPPDYPLL